MTTAPTEMTLQRLQALLAAYGAKPARWPQAERLAAQQLLLHHPAAAELQGSAQALDEFLDAWQSPAPPSHSAAASIMQGLPARPVAVPSADPLWRWLERLMDWRVLSPALAAMLVAGIALGLQLTPKQPVDYSDADWLSFTQLQGSPWISTGNRQ
jgi:anti-sigma-K factor RskA